MSSYWIPLSRLFYSVVAIQMPITLYIVLDTTYDLDVDQLKVMFLSLANMLIFYIFGFLLTLLFEIPIKIMFKKFRFDDSVKSCMVIKSNKNIQSFKRSKGDENEIEVYKDDDEV